MKAERARTVLFPCGNSSQIFSLLNSSKNEWHSNIALMFLDLMCWLALLTAALVVVPVLVQINMRNAVLSAGSMLLNSNSATSQSWGIQRWWCCLGRHSSDMKARDALSSITTELHVLHQMMSIIAELSRYSHSMNRTANKWMCSCWSSLL